MNRETVVRNVIHKYSNAFNPFEQCAVTADDEEMEYEFLTEGIQALQAVGEVSPFSAMAATIGTGNIVGLATAMVSGGPGALVWNFSDIANALMRCV